MNPYTNALAQYADIGYPQGDYQAPQQDTAMQQQFQNNAMNQMQAANQAALAGNAQALQGYGMGLQGIGQAGRRPQALLRGAGALRAQHRHRVRAAQRALGGHRGQQPGGARRLPGH